MKSLVAIVNTHFQLLTIVNIKQCCFPNENFDIIITDELSDYKKIGTRIEAQNIFRNVYMIEASDLIHASHWRRIFCRLSALLFSNHFIQKRFVASEIKYDYFFFDNMDSLLTNLLYGYFYKRNKKIKGIFYEEGIGVCTDRRLSLKGYKTYQLMRLKCRLLKCEMLDENIDRYWCFDKKMVHASIDINKIAEIPLFSTGGQEYINIINRIYDYHNLKDNYQKKYIFFEESFISNPGMEMVEDEKLILEVINLLGKENVIVKRHPRNREDRFEKYGIETNKNFAIPWEVIVMNEAFQNSMFITVSSGAVLTSLQYFDVNVPTVFLNYCMGCEIPYWNTFRKNVVEIMKMHPECRFIIPKSKEELLSFIKEESERNRK